MNNKDNIRDNSRSEQELHQEQYDNDKQDVVDRLFLVKNKIVVLSGKGGVGKSTIAVNLAATLINDGNRVGLLDIDIHGPSVPHMLNLTGKSMMTAGSMIEPIIYGNSLKVVSVGLATTDNDAPIIWRGPMKTRLIKQFLSEADWGELDYLIIDSPPGTGDEPLSVAQLIPHPTYAIMVTTPQQVAINDVRKCIRFCEHVNFDLLGVVENMSGFTCPYCHEKVDIFCAGGGKDMASKMGVDFLGNIPLEPEITITADTGNPFVLSNNKGVASAQFNQIVKRIRQRIKDKNDKQSARRKNHNVVKIIRIAFPVCENKLCPHFGQTDNFLVVDVDSTEKQVLRERVLHSPKGQTGWIPRWLKQQDVDVVVSPGSSHATKKLFALNGIHLVQNVNQEEPREALNALLVQDLNLIEDL